MGRYAGKITTFVELFHEIAYSWDFSADHYKFEEYEPGVWGYNKLTITPTEVHYKMDSWELAPEAYEKFLKFVVLFENSEKLP